MRPTTGACWHCTTRQHPHLPRYRTGRISGAACNTTTRASLYSARKPALTDAPHSILQVMVPPSTLGGNTENMLPRHSHHRYGQLHSTRERPTASLDDDTCKRVPQPYFRLPRLAMRCCGVICKSCGQCRQTTHLGSSSECPRAPIAAAHREQLLLPAKYGGLQVDSPVGQCISAHIAALVERVPCLRNALRRWRPTTDAAAYDGIYRACAGSISHRLAGSRITSIVA